MYLDPRVPLQKKRKPRGGSSVIENKSGALLKLRSGGR